MSAALSFEFFPPRTEAGQAALQVARAELAPLNPGYFSVTFGAGGSTQEGTFETVVDTQAATGIDVAPHLSCIGSTRDNIAALLQRYRDQGVRRIVALRGDMPSGMGAEPGELRYASELVAFIRQTHGDWFHIEVAAYPEMHPQASSPDADLNHFVAKVEQGADAAITQYFYNPAAYYDFVDRVQAKGVSIPIIPGVMPITNYQQLTRFSTACGADIPRWVALRLEAYRDDLPSLRAFGLDVVTDLSQQLLQAGAPGIHFYTLNRAEPCLSVARQVFTK